LSKVKANDSRLPNTLTFDINSPHVVEAQGIIPSTRDAIPMPARADILQGTLDLLILRSLLLQPMHGWAISKRIRQLSDDVLQVNQGSLYPALYRLEDRGLITSEWGVSEEGRRARVYRLSRAGKKQLTAEQAEWRRFATAIEQVLQGT
jgi:PadR family transcriptional regulator, regulatory protein PadR